VNFFKIFYSDRSPFIKTYHEQRGDKELNVTKWTNSPQFGMIRDIQYFAPVKIPLGPDRTRVQETQRYHLQRGRLLVETIAMMLDIPYGESFRLEARWDVSSASDPAYCRLVVSLGVHFVKKTWLKGKIESQSIKESKQSFQQWVELAREALLKGELVDRLTNHSPATIFIPQTLIVQGQQVSLNTIPEKPEEPRKVEEEALSEIQEQPKVVTPVAVVLTTSASASAFQVSPLRNEAKTVIVKNTMKQSRVQVLLSHLQGGDKAVFALCLAIAIFFCIMMYCRILFLEGKIAIVEKILEKHMHLHDPE